MILDTKQVKELLDILDKYQAIFIGNNIGTDFLSIEDEIILTSAGINLDDFKNSKGVIEQAFLFGMLSEAIGNDASSKMNYKQFKGFIESKKFIPLNEGEEFALNIVKTRALNDIKGLGNKIKQGTTNIIVAATQRDRRRIEKIIREKTEEAIISRENVSWLASELHHATGDWDRDFDRIADYLLHEAYDTGRIQSILKEYGEDAEVYKDVYEEACEHCKTLYLIDPQDPNSEPIIFNIIDIIQNGNNIGRKVDDWLPTVGPTHPYCRCTITHKQPNYRWNPQLRAFNLPDVYVSKNPKLANLNIKVKVGNG